MAIPPIRLKLGLLMLFISAASLLQAQKATTERWPDGYLKMAGALKGKKRHGTFIWLNELQDTIRIEEYEKGRLLSSKVLPQTSRLFDSNGRLVEFRRYDLDGNLRNAHAISLFGGEGQQKDCIVRYEYHENGQLAKRIRADQHGDILKGHAVAPVTEYTYDATGKLTGEWHKDANGNLYEDAMDMAFVRYSYDAEGRLVSRTCHRADSSLVGADFGTASLIYEYDASGCKTKALRLDEVGDTAIMDLSGPPLLLYRCDDQGRSTTELAYVQGGTLLGKIQTQYDVQGRVVRSEFYDGQDTTRMEDYTLYEYSDSGFLLSKRTFSPQGRLLDEDKSGIQVEAKGWTWPDMPAIADAGKGSGRLVVSITIRPEGTLSHYESIIESCDTDLKDEACDWLNHLRLTPSAANPATEGKITFLRLD
jgi:YD repeat-containing protein